MHIWNPVNLWWNDSCLYLFSPHTAIHWIFLHLIHSVRTSNANYHRFSTLYKYDTLFKSNSTIYIHTLSRSWWLLLDLIFPWNYTMNITNQMCAVWFCICLVYLHLRDKDNFISNSLLKISIQWLRWESDTLLSVASESKLVIRKMLTCR